MPHPTTLARGRSHAGASLTILVAAALLAGCATSAAPSASSGGGSGSSATGAASSGSNATEAPSAAATSAASAAGPKAKTCRELLSDSEVSQATGLANATLKSVDVTAPILSETHCIFDAGSTTVEVSVWSADRLTAFDALSAAQSNPVALDIPGVTAMFFDLSFESTAVARTADHGLVVGLTPGDTPIPDMKAAATALLRLMLGRI